MSDDINVEAPKIDERRDWRRWCRLCAKCDPETNISVFESSSNSAFDASLTAAIGKYFWVNIKIDDSTSRYLCVQCHTLMSELINFANRVNRVQAMFCVLESVEQASVDAFGVRKQYGVSDEEWEHIIKPDPPKPLSDEDYLIKEQLEQSIDEQNIETLDYDNASDIVKEEEEGQKHKMDIGKETLTAVSIATDEIIGEYVEEIAENNDFETEIMDAELNESNFEVEFMNENESPDDVPEIALINGRIVTYKCSLCSKLYRHPGNYRKHVAQAHKNAKKHTDSDNQNATNSSSNESKEAKKTAGAGDSSFGESADEESQSNLDVADNNGNLSQSELSDSTQPAERFKRLNSSEESGPAKKIKTDDLVDESVRVSNGGGSGGRSNAIRYHCDLCNRPYKSPGCYKRHMFESHQVVAAIIGIPCDYCEESFATDKQLAAHRRKHLPFIEKLDFECSYCDKKFTTSAALRQHVSGIHLNEKPFVCDECGKSLKTLASLNEHKLVHTDNKPVECEVCGKGFKNKARMKVHMDIHASTGYKCSECGLNLNTRRTLKMHMLVHSDEKLYKCSFCQSEFKRSKALKNHLILHTGMRPFKCPYCDKSFSNGSNCRSHKKKVHPKELAEDEAKGIKRTDQDYVPNLDQLRTGAVMQTVKQITRNKNGGLPPRMRALLIAAEKRVVEDASDFSIRSVMTDSMDSFVVEEMEDVEQGVRGADNEVGVEEEEFDGFDVNEQEVHQETEDDASVAISEVSVSQTDDNEEETIIYEVLDSIQGKCFE